MAAELIRCMLLERFEPGERRTIRTNLELFDVDLEVIELQIDKGTVDDFKFLRGLPISQGRRFSRTKPIELEVQNRTRFRRLFAACVVATRLGAPD